MSPQYYLRNIIRRLFNPSYLSCFLIDFKKQGVFRKLLSIPFHMPPGSLFYLFLFRNGKRSRKSIIIGPRKKWNLVLNFVSWMFLTSVSVCTFILWPFCRVFFFFLFTIFSFIMLRLCWSRECVERVEKSSEDEKGKFRTGAEKIAVKVWRTITPEYLERLYQLMPWLRPQSSPATEATGSIENHF